MSHFLLVWTHVSLLRIKLQIFFANNLLHWQNDCPFEIGLGCRFTQIVHDLLKTRVYVALVLKHAIAVATRGLQDFDDLKDRTEVDVTTQQLHL